MLSISIVTVVDSSAVPVDNDERVAENQPGLVALLRSFFDTHAAAIGCAIRRRMSAEVCLFCDIEDILQQTWLKMLKCKLQLKHFEPPNKLLSYIIRVAHREILQVLRSRRRTERKSVEHISAEEMHVLRDRAALPLEVMITEERWECAVRNLGPIPSHRLAAELLREGYSHAEIAERAHICERTVRRVVQLLRRLILNYNPEAFD